MLECCDAHLEHDSDEIESLLKSQVDFMAMKEIISYAVPSYVTTWKAVRSNLEQTKRDIIESIDEIINYCDQEIEEESNVEEENCPMCKGSSKD